MQTNHNTVGHVIPHLDLRSKIDTDHLVVKDPHRQRSQLKFPIIFGPVGQYSIGDDPVTLWIHYQGCWFEVRPTSPKYQRVSKEMANTVKLYYLGLDFYATFAEKFEKFRVPPASFNEPFEIIRQVS